MNTPNPEDLEKRWMVWAWVFACVLFGGLFVYAVYGAYTGDLNVPIRSRGGPACHVSGEPAWVYAGGVALVWLALMVRAGAFPALSESRQRALGLLSFLLGMAAIAFVGFACLK